MATIGKPIKVLDVPAPVKVPTPVREKEPVPA